MLQEGDSQGRLAYFHRTLARDPSYYRAYHNLGLADYQLGHTGQAKGDFQKSIELSNGGLRALSIRADNGALRKAGIS